MWWAFKKIVVLAIFFVLLFVLATFVGGSIKSHKTFYAYDNCLTFDIEVDGVDIEMGSRDYDRGVVMISVKRSNIDKILNFEEKTRNVISVRNKVKGRTISITLPECYENKVKFIIKIKNGRLIFSSLFNCDSIEYEVEGNNVIGDLPKINRSQNVA